MAIICPDAKLLFIMVPGTGCSVVGRALEKHLGGQFLPEKDIVKDNKVVHPRKHNTAEQLLRDGVIDSATLDDYTVAATVRNPFDRFVTYYQRFAGEWVDYSLNVQRQGIQRRRERYEQDEFDELNRALDDQARVLKRRQRLIRMVGFNNWLKWNVVRFLLKERLASGASRENRRDFLYPMLAHVDVALRFESLQQSLNALLARLGVEVEIELERRNVTQGKKPFASYYSRSTAAFVAKTFRDELDQFDYTLETTGFDSPLVNLNEVAAPSKQPA